MMFWGVVKKHSTLPIVPVCGFFTVEKKFPVPRPRGRYFRRVPLYSLLHQGKKRKVCVLLVRRVK